MKIPFITSPRLEDLVGKEIRLFSEGISRYEEIIQTMRGTIWTPDFGKYQFVYLISNPTGIGGIDLREQDLRDIFKNNYFWRGSVGSRYFYDNPDHENFKKLSKLLDNARHN